MINIIILDRSKHNTISQLSSENSYIFVNRFKNELIKY